ncbi:hypothetical protein PSMK_24280 [Phycisphaera mikurensis NBRC 102666]|uniref:Uncharacterized protein n=1 Tax=Phycisphaera mikurensis (strain NBRC 102666 / KCTC 22515 / FYK2301M01) TaxID=1142394 RepID=I0IH49_PHYMF|nr:hypothetical protein PSMK_24280 [Phycisphaera mikurensis NBRC 102666]
MDEARGPHARHPGRSIEAGACRVGQKPVTRTSNPCRPLPLSMQTAPAGGSHATGARAANPPPPGDRGGG